jgi:hypothetical protein
MLSILTELAPPIKNARLLMATYQIELRTQNYPDAVPGNNQGSQG